MIPRAAQAERFTLQLSTVTPVADLRRWLDMAPAGHQVIYASGIDLPRAAEGVVLARQWQAQGLVDLNQRRDPDNARRWQFLMRRRAADAARCPTASALDKVLEKSRARKLLNLLRDHAEAGRACPSNSELARAMGWDMTSPTAAEKGRAGVQYLLRAIERAGGITIESRGTMAPRIITITAAGRAKGRSTGTPAAP